MITMITNNDQVMIRRVSWEENLEDLLEYAVHALYTVEIIVEYTTNIITKNSFKKTFAFLLS